MWMVMTSEFYGIYGNVSWSGISCAWQGVFGVGTLPGMALSGRRLTVRWYVRIKCLFTSIVLCFPKWVNVSANESL
jgi:hypothetical protein